MPFSIHNKSIAVEPVGLFAFFFKFSLLEDLSANQTPDRRSFCQRERRCCREMSEDIELTTCRCFTQASLLLAAVSPAVKFCCKHLNLIFIPLLHYRSAYLLSACVECWHCKAVPRSALLSRCTSCGVEECLKHTLSNPFLFSSLEGVCLLQQSNPLISIPHFGRDADSSISAIRN